MTKGVIYFPYVNIPQDQWFTQALLYWDHVYSIAPRPLIQNPSHLSLYMQELKQENLVELVNPADFIDSIPHFQEDFTDYLERSGIVARGGEKGLRNLPTWGLYSEKMSMELARLLEDKGLARSIDGEYIQVEKTTAEQYMIYLAARIGNRLNSNPITDNTTDFGSLDNQGYHIINQINMMRGTVLMDILPTPADTIQPAAIKDFKSEHEAELNRFRDEIESFLIDAVEVTDPTIRRLKVAQFIESKRDEILELSNDMRSRGWRNITRGRLFTYLEPLANLSLGIVTGGLAMIPGVLGFINKGVEMREYIEGRDLLKGSKVAYALLANKEFGQILRS
jgi:hypothetical protein